MTLIITLSWVWWAISIYDRRQRSPYYQAKWHRDFCRRQRAKSGASQ